MPMSWADAVADAAATESAVPAKSYRPDRSSYVPPHLRNNNSFPAESPPPPMASLNEAATSSRFPHSGSREFGRPSSLALGRPPPPPRRERGRRAHEPNPFQITDRFQEMGIQEEEEEDGAGGAINFDAYEDIPVDTSGVDVPPPVNTFEEIDLGDALNLNIQRCKYVKPTPVQRHAIPILLAHRDLMACAQTGSGKTAAFCFPIICGIMRGVSPPQIRRPPPHGARTAYPLALILSPTRELSCQIHEEARKFSFQTGVKVAVAYGGAPIHQQLRDLEKGVDILVATPGRLVDLIERKRISLQMIKYLALDEADRMLDMGFEPQIRKIVEQADMPPPGERQTMLFSATFPHEIQKLASDFLSNYIFLAVGRIGSSTNLIVQRVEFVQDMDKRSHLMELLHCQRVNGFPKKQPLTLVFVETKRGADSLEHWLCMNRFPATAIHGDKSQPERERALRTFKGGITPILVATDVAARGLDVPHVAHVINFDLPKDIDDYVHRIGRTGRAGKTGLATAFFNDGNQTLGKALVELMQEANQEIPAWLVRYAETSYGGGRSRRSGGRFGGHDFRRDVHSRGGGGYYNSNSYGGGAGGVYSNSHGADTGNPYSSPYTGGASNSYGADTSNPYSTSYGGGANNSYGADTGNPYSTSYSGGASNSYGADTSNAYSMSYGGGAVVSGGGAVGSSGVSVETYPSQVYDYAHGPIVATGWE